MLAPGLIPRCAVPRSAHSQREIADKRARQNNFTRQLADISRTLSALGVYHVTQVGLLWKTWGSYQLHSVQVPAVTALLFLVAAAPMLDLMISPTTCRQA